MDITALFLSRLQFAFAVSFHIIFPSFTIGLAAWLHIVSNRVNPRGHNSKSSGCPLRFSLLEYMYI
jgi:hypothetical protein